MTTNKPPENITQNITDKDNQSPHDNRYVDQWGKDWADEKAREMTAKLFRYPPYKGIVWEPEEWIAQVLREAVAAETEACAKVVDHFTGSLWDASEARLASQIVRAIRDRKHD